MNTCKTCKHWKGPDANNYNEKYALERLDPDTMEPMAIPWEVRFCKSPLLRFHEFPVESNEASIYDASQCYGWLITGPDFGCVLYENNVPRNAEEADRQAREMLKEIG